MPFGYSHLPHLGNCLLVLGSGNDCLVVVMMGLKKAQERISTLPSFVISPSITALGRLIMALKTQEDHLNRLQNISV